MNGINPTYIQSYASSITGIINAIIVPVLISIAFLVFLWGIYVYFIKGADNEEARKKGKIFSLYGIIGFVVLFSVWGIVNIFMGTLGLSAGNMPSLPLFGTGSYSPGTSIFGSPYSRSSQNLTPTQSQTYTSWTQAQNTYNSICSQNSSSAECKKASSDLQQAFLDWKGASGGVGGGALGSSCSSPNDCSGALTCDRGACVQLTGAGGCAVGSTLDEFGACSPTSSSGSVLSGTCSDTEPCSGNLVCSGGTCVLPTGINNCAIGFTLDESSGCVPLSSSPTNPYGDTNTDEFSF